MKAFVGTFLNKNTLGTQVVFCGSVNPTLVIFWSESIGTASGLGVHAGFCVGASDGTNHKSIYCFDRDAQATTDALKWSRDSAFCFGTGDLYFEARIQSLGSGQFTLDYTTVNFYVTGRIIHFLALEVPNAKVGQILSPTSPGTVTETVGCDAKCGLLFGINHTAHPVSSVVADATFWVGLFDSALNNGGMGFSSDDAQATSNTNRYHDTMHLWRALGGTGSLDVVGAVDQIASTTFRTDFTTVLGSQTYGFYAVWDPPNAKVEPAQTYPTITGSQTYDPSFTPKAIIQIGSGCTVAQQDTGQSNALLDFGAADDSANQGVVWIGSEDNLGTSNANRYQDATNVSVQYDKTGTTLQQKGAVTGMSSAGTAVNWSTVPATALSGAWLQMGDYSGTARRGGFRRMRLGV